MESSTIPRSPNRNPADGSPSRNKKNNGWTSKKEKLLKYWQEECRLYVWLHNKNASYYRKLNKIITLPAILITAVTSTALFSTSGNDEDKPLIISFGILLVIGTFLQSTKEFLGIENQIHRNTNCSISYQSIVNEIEEQLTQDILDRMDGKQFLRKTKNAKNDIVRNGPSISSGTWDKLKKSMKRGEVINLYGTNFFHDYISNLDNLEKGNNSDDPQKAKRNSLYCPPQTQDRRDTFVPNLNKNKYNNSKYDKPSIIKQSTSQEKPILKTDIEQYKNNENDYTRLADIKGEYINENVKINIGKKSNVKIYDDKSVNSDVSNTNDNIVSSVNKDDGVRIDIPTDDVYLTSNSSINYNSVVLYKGDDNNYESAYDETDDEDDYLQNNINMQQIRNNLIKSANQDTSQTSRKKHLLYQMTRM
jgi:hypothetical protein